VQSARAKIERTVALLTGIAPLETPEKKTTITEAGTMMRRVDMSPRRFDKM